MMYEDKQVKPKKKSFLQVIKSVFSGIYSTVETFVIALAFVVFLYLFVASPHEVLGRSMEDNYHDGEYLIVDVISYRFRDPLRGDVIIFKYSETQDYIKRIIGLPGETIALRDGSYYINGEILDESEYLASSVYTGPGKFLKEGEEFQIPTGSYFVSGDNRPNSSDSRTFGSIERSQIKGRAVITYWPVSNLNVTQRPTYNEE